MSGTANINLSGGTMNIGSSGIADGGGGGTKNINLGAGTIGAFADWSSSLDMKLTNTTDGTTIDTLDSVDNATARTITLSGALSGTGGKLLKTGAGTLILSSTTNTYTGPTDVNEGTLVISGNISTSSLTVGANGTLSGNGTVGATSVLGTLAIGNSPGTMTFAGDLTLGLDSISNFEINGFDLGDFDLAQAATTGTQTVNFNGGALNILFPTGFNTNGTAKIFEFDSYSGEATAFNPTGLAEGYTASFDYANGTVTVVPEPGATLLGGLGLLALLRRRR